MRIAILGSAPSSLHLAPYDDPSWTIWGCSQGAAQSIKRVDAFFEIHRWGQGWLTDEYRRFLANLNKPVYMIEPQPEIPTSVAYPKAEMLEKFGPYFFTSTPAWMLALAISQQPEEIGFWGIDMASNDEYVQQKQGCMHFIEVARDRGIKVTIPAQSDLHRPPPLYGFVETSPMMVKMLARQEELQARLNHNRATVDGLIREEMFLKGALDDLGYIINTWTQ